MLECTQGPGKPKVRVTERALVLSLAEYLPEQRLGDTECPWAKLFSIQEICMTSLVTYFL